MYMWLTQCVDFVVSKWVCPVLPYILVNLTSPEFTVILLFYIIILFNRVHATRQFHTHKINLRFHQKWITSVIHIIYSTLYCLQDYIQSSTHGFKSSFLLWEVTTQWLINIAISPNRGLCGEARPVTHKCMDYSPYNMQLTLKNTAILTR